MWTLAHEQGIALPVKDYWEFVELVTVDPRGVEGLPELDQIYKWTELIQSSPLAVERSVHGAIGGAYSTQNITTLELRFNPMKRNRGGERDLDHIIMAAVRGLDRAEPRVPARARRPHPDDGPHLHARAERGHRREGDPLPRRAASSASTSPARGPNGGRYPYRDLAPLVETARAAGLGVTIHVGEEGGADGIAEIGEVVETCAPSASATGSSPPRTRRPCARSARRRRPRDLPDLEPADARARRRGRPPRHDPDVRRPRRRRSRSPPTGRR